MIMPTWRQRRMRPEPLVVLVDISGSMSRYSRMFLHFMHALVSGGAAANLRVHTFVFGTRLTHITRQLAARDPDEALAAVVDAVDDWSGGTRIARAARIQPALGAARVVERTDGAADHRWTRTRRRRSAAHAKQSDWLSRAGG